MSFLTAKVRNAINYKMTRTTEEIIALAIMNKINIAEGGAADPAIRAYSIGILSAIGWLLGGYEEQFADGIKVVLENCLEIDDEMTILSDLLKIAAPVRPS